MDYTFYDFASSGGMVSLLFAPSNPGIPDSISAVGKFNIMVQNPL